MCWVEGDAVDREASLPPVFVNSFPGTHPPSFIDTHLRLFSLWCRVGWLCQTLDGLQCLKHFGFLQKMVANRAVDARAVWGESI